MNRMLRSVGMALVFSASMLGGCSRSTPPGYPGYVEGEYVLVASPLSGTLSTLGVQRGDTVTKGTMLFALESDQEQAAVAQAQARVRQAQATLADLEKGRRPPEVAAARAQLAQAQASAAQSQADLERTQKLVADKFLPPQQLDQAKAARDRDRARVAELTEQVRIANLPARADQVAASQADVKAAMDALAQAQWRVAQKSQSAPAAGRVVDTLYRTGEWVAAGAPIVSLLPPANVKVRFYIPETLVGTLRIGGSVVVRCDGCGGDIPAAIRFIAPQAEFTPPVIYSRQNRANLVFLVEAWPRQPNPALHPGLPVEVVLGASTADGAS